MAAGLSGKRSISELMFKISPGVARFLDGKIRGIRAAREIR
jgi:hypothetical protein